MKEHETYYLYDTTQGSQDWLEMRKGRITMSNLGKVVGHCPFGEKDPSRLAKIFKGPSPRVPYDHRRRSLSWVKSIFQSLRPSGTGTEIVHLMILFR